ncbi:MAG: fluoride efflux transporter FluC [Acidimicrobiia bacterium]
MNAVWFAIAAAGGGLVRHGVNLLGRAWIGTLLLNVVGSLVLGYVVGADLSAEVRLILGTAACGSLTTFSTFSLEVVEARDTARIRITVVTVAATVAAASAGYWLS